MDFFGSKVSGSEPQGTPVLLIAFAGIVLVVVVGVVFILTNKISAKSSCKTLLS